MALRVKKGHCNVTGSLGGWKTFVIVGQAAWVHQGPPLPWSSNGAIVAQEPAASSLTETKQETHQLGKSTSGKGSLPLPAALLKTYQSARGILLCFDALKKSFYPSPAINCSPWGEETR